MKTFKRFISLKYIFVPLFPTLLLVGCGVRDVIEPVGQIVLSSASMQNVSVQQTKVNLSWVYGGNASQLQHYRIEYSLHHGAWVALQTTVPNDESSLEIFLPAATFYVGNTYDWRVVAVGNFEEAASCYREARIPMDEGLKLPSTAFNQTTQMHLIFITTNQGLFSAGIHPVIDEWQGSQWVEIVDNISNIVGANGFVNLPPVFMANKTYRIKLHGAESYYGINTNYVVFTYAPPHPNPC